MNPLAELNALFLIRDAIEANVFDLERALTQFEKIHRMKKLSKQTSLFGLFVNDDIKSSMEQIKSCEKLPL